MPMSLHHPSKTANAQRALDELLRKYRQNDAPSPIMVELFNDHDGYSVILDALRRQISLAKCRSQEFEDCQITVYDRALLILSNYGQSATDPGALELYLTEYLGIVPFASLTEDKEVVAKQVQLHNVLDRAAAQASLEKRDAAPPVAPASTHFKQEHDGLSSPFNIDNEYERIYRYGDEDTKPTHPPAEVAQAHGPDVRVTRLLEVYQQAKNDYLTTKERDNFDSLDAVRFLRDSAENALRYLRANGPQDHPWVPDLEQTFNIARDKTAQLLGGRKRHFDEDNRGRRRPVHRRSFGQSNLSVSVPSPEMASFRPPLAGPASNESSGSSMSHAQYTPDSDGSDNGQASRNPEGLWKLQTDSGSVDDRFSEDDIDEYNYNDEAQPKFTRPRVSKYTHIEEQQVVKRFDRRLVPFLALLYLLSFLDRSNIGNAKIAGLMEDLKLSSSQYEWLLTTFYITYILFEWMTLLYRVFPAHVYISLCVCGWGLVASFQSLASSFGAMVFLRAVLGITEAAFGPGIPFYLSLFYKREELALRTGLFISAAPLASSFASSLAWLIVKSSSDGPIAPWRSLFLVEGFPSVIVAVFAWFMIPDAPGSAAFLEPRQRMVAQLRMGESANPKYPTYRRRFNWGEVAKTLADPKAYITACSMGYSSTNSQALSAPPYLFAFIIVLITAYLSDRARTRSPYLITHSLISCTAYATIALIGTFHSSISTSLSTTIRYLCVYPAVAGFFSAITLIITWSMDNRVANEGKGASVAILNVIGQCGPLLGTRLYPASDGPLYVKGMSICAGFMGLVAVLAVALRASLKKANERVQRGEDVGDGTDREREGLIFGSFEDGPGRCEQKTPFSYII
ncbi:major facilitator superfamily domain-containing protein [Aspergillus venezuelensis]